MRKALILFAAVLIFVAGCTKGSPIIDASTEETLRTSLQEVQDSMPAEKQAQFQAAVMLITLSGMSMSEMASGDSSSRTLENLKQRLHGKTGDEVIAEAEAIKHQNTTR